MTESAEGVLRSVISTPAKPDVSDTLAAAGAALFIVVLTLAAYWDASIRVLHAFEAIPYVAGAALALRRSKYGYLLGMASGAVWLLIAGFLTRFIRNGFERLTSLLQTGHVDRWDIFIAVPAAIGTAGLAFFSAVSYVRSSQKSWSDLGALVVAIMAVAGFFVGIFYLFAPQYLGMFQPLVDCLRKVAEGAFSGRRAA
jgi:hypothetical protein